MTIQIYHKERWVYLSTRSGSLHTHSKAKAFDFTEKECEKVVDYMKSLGFLTRTE